MSCFPFDDVAQTLELAEAVRGAAVVIDPNPRSGMLTDRAEFVRGFEQLVPGRR